MIIEVCANGYESALAAQKAGADRIELCTQLSVGGLTPSFGVIEKVISELTIDVHVLIRPRAGDFYYSEIELECMLRDIRLCKELGCKGVVSGALTPENTIDLEATKRLINAAGTMEFTFHRAFDIIKNPLQALQQLESLEVTRLLSSGLDAKAINGIDVLKQLVSEAKNIQIMPGSGINIDNAASFKKAGFSMLHFSAIGKPNEIKSYSNVSFSEGNEGVSDATTIRKIIEIVKG